MGLLKSLFKGIKNIVKGVVKGIKNVVKGVAKVVKKVAKSKVFKAILIAAAIYVTGGAAAGAFGSTGAWATSVSNFMASGTFLSTVATPFAKLGTELGTGARGVSDWAGWTTKGAELGASGITEVVPLTAEESFKAGLQEIDLSTLPQKRLTAEEVFKAGLQEIDLSTLPQKKAITKTRSKWVQGLGSWAKGVAGSVTSGYILNELQGEDPAGTMFAGDIEGKGYFDPLTIYGMDGRPLDMNSIYESLLYGNIDPFAGKDPLYTQATV